jgi:hypothetical protein
MADGLGGKIGTRIADINTRAKADMLRRAAPLFVSTGMALQEEFFRLTGSELVRTVGPLYRALADAADPGDWVKPTMQFLADGHGQLSTLIGVSGISSGFGQGIGAVVNNDLNPIVTTLVRAHPNALLSVPDLATAVARGLLPIDNALTDATGQGFREDRFLTLIQLSQQALAPVEILDLLNRGVLTRDRALEAFTRTGYNRDTALELMGLQHAVLSVQDLAAMENRGIVSVEEGRRIAAQTGYSAQDFDRYDLLAGEPPDLTTTILAWQRGIITEADVDRAILQGPLRREWIPVAKNLRWQPLSASDAADAVNQGHMTLAHAQQVARENGLKPEDFQVIIDNAGIPPGPQEALDWVSRGIITPAEFETIFLESRIKNKYIGLYLESRTRLLTLAEVRLLYRDGAMSKDQAITRLQSIGFSPENAAIIVNGASAQRTAKARDLTRDQVISLYRDRIITRDDAATMLDAMGWDAQEANWLIDLADMQRFETFTNAALSRTRSQYVARKIDANQASAAMDALAIAPDARDSYIALWDIERDVVTKELTTAEVIQAARKGIITVDDARNRLLGQGYAPDDADIKLAIAGLLGP